jgi:hypothetical protein
MLFLICARNADYALNAVLLTASAACSAKSRMLLTAANASNAVHVNRPASLKQLSGSKPSKESEDK